MIAGNHIIGKQSIGIEYEDPDEAMGLQNLIAEVFYEKLQPRMEILFDELFGEIYFASVDKLEIDCGVLSKKNWEQEFTEQAIRQMRAALVQVNRKEIDVDEAAETNAIETFFFFLEHGFLPWNHRTETIAELEQLVKVNEKLITKIKELIIRQANVANRLAGQFSEKFISKIIDGFTKNRKEELAGILSIIEKQHPSGVDRIMDKHLVDVSILSMFAEDGPVDRGHRLLALPDRQAVSNEKMVPGTGEHHVTAINGKPDQTTQRKNVEPGQAIYIRNAGLVLLHPFLPRLFERLELAFDNKWPDEDSQYFAVMITSFLASGNEVSEEFNQVLDKILCGVDTGEVVATRKTLTPWIKEECESLLNEVIAQWGGLKNTSIGGLRETFLQRNGKLSKVDNGWQLQVEQQAVDVLLGQLPWGIGIVKLPWMNEILFVDW